METVMQSEFYLKDDVNKLLDEMGVKSSWATAEMARNIRENLNKLPSYLIAVQRETK